MVREPFRPCYDSVKTVGPALPDPPSTRPHALSYSVRMASGILRPTTSGGSAERVRLLLEEDILGGRLPPGSRINADDLARRLGVSHIPVREALRALDAAGWVIHRPHQGASVRERDAAELADLFEAREIVESEVAALAAVRRTASDLEALEEIVDRQQFVREPGDLARVNYDFHAALAGCAHNSTLADVCIAMSKRVRFYYLPTASARRQESLADHRAMVEAVRRRDADAVREMARVHVTRTRTDAYRALEIAAGSV